MAGKRDKKGSGRAIIIIKKMGDDGAGGHHGGAWKVAYADFVTAMMAFFLLMWLLNATTEDQRKGLADYFSPNSQLSHASSGTGDPFGGHTAFDEGAMVSDRGTVEINDGKRPPLDATVDGDPQVQTRARRRAADMDEGATSTPTLIRTRPIQPVPAGEARSSDGPSQDGDRQPNRAEIQAEKERQEKAAFAKAADEIRAAVSNDPSLAAAGETTRHRHDTRRHADPDHGRGQAADVHHRFGSSQRSGAFADPEDRTGSCKKLPEAIPIAGIYRRDTLCRFGKIQLGAVQ